MESPRIVGHVVSVNGFQVKVEILKEARSPSRATLDGVQTAIAINSYLTFSIGAGRTIIGIITNLEARESYDPKSGDELSLELLKARRTISVQLLGTIEKFGEKAEFNPGITVLPTLDTPAEVGTPEALAAVFENPPQRNKPDDYGAREGFDNNLAIGIPTGEKNRTVMASYNDLFSRPLAIVGNTGSGKSYSVASLLQKAMEDGRLGKDRQNAPHIFILDINGEYARAFLSKEEAKYNRLPDRIYLNGEKFGIPLWFFNAQEICAWLSASEQTQEPVLKDWWAIVKSKFLNNANNIVDKNLRHGRKNIEDLLKCLDDKDYKKKNCYTYLKTAATYIRDKNFPEFNNLESAVLDDADGYKIVEEALENDDKKTGGKIDWYSLKNEKEVREAAEKLVKSLNFNISETIEKETSGTADTPLFIGKENLVDPALIDRAVSKEDKGKIDSHLTTLKLRLRTRLDDRRWGAFLNYEKTATKFSNLLDWFEKFGFKETDAKRVSIIDLSMLSHEALPYACAVIGRILLEARERLKADKRYKNPWVLVLEEAHNYARPARQNEEKGQELSRHAFERIAKEGRKFGFSLIVASQRPSEISATIISQCANFISHRLQNPDDIDHFRRVIPRQAQRLLEQVTILASGEAIVFGSAFHIPTRVQIDKPENEPWSQTAAPFYEWKSAEKKLPLDYERKSGEEGFPLDEVIESWGLAKDTENTTSEDDTSKNEDNATE